MKTATTSPLVIAVLVLFIEVTNYVNDALTKSSTWG